MLCHLVHELLEYEVNDRNILCIVTRHVALLAWCVYFLYDRHVVLPNVKSLGGKGALTLLAPRPYRQFGRHWLKVKLQP